MAQTLQPDSMYDRLMRAPCCAGGVTPFDAHVLAAMLALAATENEAAGFSDHALLEQIFPSENNWLQQQPVTADRSADEQTLLALLQQGATTGTPLERLLAEMMARRAQRPNHLWQDLGLANRDELGHLMQTHFAPLARLNRADMKWKKFFYRQLCRNTAYSLCMAPSCCECSDFDGCFGEESGESLLAHIRRRADLAA